MTRYKIWLLKLILPIRYGRSFTGLLLLALLLPLFYAGSAESSEHRPPALFFSLIIAYIIPVFSFITAKSQEALDALRPALDLNDVEFNQIRAHLDSARIRLTLNSLVAGVLAGCAHITLIRGSAALALSDMLSGVTGILTVLGTLMVWIVMTTVIVLLIQQSVLFGRLGRTSARVSLLDIRKLRPFARVSISSSLAVIGALALFPLINLEGGLNLVESLPGAIAILGPLVIMFVIPVWPVHQRLATLKERELTALDDRIAASLDGTGGVNIESGDLDRLLPLLDYRREIAQLSTWPFDLGNVTTFVFYLIIPPLTWAGAALIEKVVNALI